MPPTAIGTPRVMPRRTLKLAWVYFQKRGVELIVRLTDADGKRWQDVRRDELERVPDGTGEMWVFAVAVDCTEDWLALQPAYLAEKLQLDQVDLAASSHRADAVKRAIKRVQKPDEASPNVVRRIVRDAPGDVARKWLQDKSFRRFYLDCRAAASRANCDTTNELEGGSV
ncbi:MAG: hypothetical protein IIB59_02960 [Planctomycetes bacterium]|nr:hypothetical protein [Planctomycetota bacterium]